VKERGFSPPRPKFPPPQIQPTDPGHPAYLNLFPYLFSSLPGPSANLRPLAEPKIPPRSGSFGFAFPFIPPVRGRSGGASPPGPALPSPDFQEFLFDRDQTCGFFSCFFFSTASDKLPLNSLLSFPYTPRIPFLPSDSAPTARFFRFIAVLHITEHLATPSSSPPRHTMVWRRCETQLSFSDGDISANFLPLSFSSPPP